MRQEEERSGRIPGCESTNHDRCYGELWQCSECGKTVCGAEGSDNDSDLCDDCWVSKHPPTSVTPDRDNRTGQSVIKPTVEAPDIETLKAWMWEDGGCEATDGCWVEVDGVCPHGHPSWALELGLV